MIDIIILAVVALGLIGVLYYHISNKKKGKTGCGCGCSGCSSKSQCSSQQNNY